jgi:hypothetical protein
MTNTRYSRIRVARTLPAEGPDDEVVEKAVEIAQKADCAFFVASVKKPGGKTEVVMIPAKVIAQLALEVQRSRRVQKDNRAEAGNS